MATRHPLRGLAAAALLLTACGGTPTGTGGVEAVVITPSTLSVGVGGIDSLSAIAIGAGGTAVTTTIAWQSLAPTIATVTGTGKVTGIVPGTARVIASAGGRADTVEVQVYGALQAITVTIDRPVIKSSDTTRVRAVGRDLGGRIVPITPEWSVSDQTVALVAPNGLVLGLRYDANTPIFATVNGISGFATVAVVPSEVKSVGVRPDAATISLGTTLLLRATVTDEFDVEVTDRQVVWTSTNTDVITVSGTGQLLAVSPGTATVRASTGGKTGSATFTVLNVPQNVYQLEVTNQLMASVRIFVNDSQVVVLQENSSSALQLPKVASIRVRWVLIRPKGGTAGEPLAETLGTVTNPDGIVNFTIDNVVNGTTYFTPFVRSLATDKFDVDLSLKDAAEVCGCPVSAAEPDRRFGYWRFGPGAAMLLISTDGARTITLPVPQSAIEAGTGIWRSTIVVGP
jgi:uncharacterized protein YjdB